MEGRLKEKARISQKALKNGSEERYRALAIKRRANRQADQALG